MSPSEQAAYAAGIAHAADMALIAAMTIEVRPDANHVRQRAAIEALRGLADGLKTAASGKSETVADMAEKGTHETRILEAGPAAPTPRLSDQRHAAIAAGYTGDPCPSCQNFTLKRSGTCQVCDSCGSTTGCS